MTITWTPPKSLPALTHLGELFRRPGPAVARPPMGDGLRTVLLRALGLGGERSLLDLPEPDPMDHPSLRGLSLRELADLPFPRPSDLAETEDAASR